MNNTGFRELLMRCECSLSDVSLDDQNNVSMVNSDKKVYNFDLFQTRYFHLFNQRKPLASLDALVENEDDWYFIEFKNGKYDNKVGKSIKEKISPSLLTFLDVIGETLTFSRKNINFVLVYNAHKNKAYGNLMSKDEIQSSEERNKIKIHLKSLSKNKSFCLFGLSRYKSVYFRDVFAYNELEFLRFIEEKAIV